MFTPESYNYEELVFRGIESDELDYKAHMSWRTMSPAARGKLLRHLTAFANTRGGFLVIGVSEDASGNPIIRTGVSNEEAGSFDPTPVGIFANQHVEPPLDFTIVRPTVRGRRYVIFVIRPFKELPHVVSTPIEGELQTGVFYLRTTEASSRPARRALELQQLFQRALRNQRELLAKMIRGILYEHQNQEESESAPNRFTDLLADTLSYFRRRKAPDENVPVFGFSIEPEFGKYRKYSLADLQAGLKLALPARLSAEFIPQKSLIGFAAADSLRYLDKKDPWMWQFFSNGLFCFFRTADAVIDLPRFVAFCAEAVAFAGELCAKMGWQTELLTLHLGLQSPGSVRFSVPQDTRQYPCITPGREVVFAEIKRSGADLESGKENHAARLIRRFAEQFNLPDSCLDQLETGIAHYLEVR